MAHIESKINWPKLAFILVLATIVYNVVEAGIAIYFGLEADSISLVSFGLDSVIEVSAATMMLWRLGKEVSGASECEIEDREQFVRRFVGGTFILLALYVTAQSALDLWYQHVPQVSLVGMVLAIFSIVIMPVMAWWKIRAARQIQSRALEMEAKETIACSYLSFVLLAGLSLNALWHWWWADPVAALLMVPWLVKEGMEGIKGEACCDG